MNLNAETLGCIIGFIIGCFFIYQGFFKIQEKNPQIQPLYKWGGVILILVYLGLFIVGLNSPVDANKIVDEFKEKYSVPLMIDPVTQLTDIKAVNEKEIELSMKVLNAENANPHLASYARQLKEEVIKNAPKNPQFAQMLKKGISITLTYYTNDNHQILTVTLPGDGEKTE